MGMVFSPSKKTVVDFYADAYFAGQWKGICDSKTELENQKLDIFTKSLQGELFVRISKLLQGWQDFR